MPEHGRCSPEAMKLVADFWVLRIIEEVTAAADGLRFSELERALAVSPATLSNRLRRLEEAGLLARCEGADGAISVTYRITERGRRVQPVIRAIDAFAETAG